MNRVTYLVLILSLFSSCKQKEVWVKPVKAPITEAIFCSGHIEPAHQVILTSVSEGYLQNAAVQESDVVDGNQVLFYLDNQTSNIEEVAARENLRIAALNASRDSPVLQKLTNDLQAARQKLATDSLQYERLKKLFETRSVAEADLDNMRLQFLTDVNNVKSLEENIEATQLSLNQTLVAARSQYLSAAAGNGYYSLRAPHLARIYRIFKKEGELVRRGEAVALLGHPDSLLVVLMVDEAGISKVRVGQKVLVELNTHRGENLAAKVVKVYPYFDNETQSFKVEATLDKQPGVLIAGTLLQANIIVGSKEQAMLIPRACLGPDGHVQVKMDGKVTKAAIKTGIVSTDWVEVLSGLDPATLVLKAF